MMRAAIPCYSSSPANGWEESELLLLPPSLLTWGSAGCLVGSAQQGPHCHPSGTPCHKGLPQTSWHIAHSLGTKHNLVIPWKGTSVGDIAPLNSVVKGNYNMRTSVT